MKEEKMEIPQSIVLPHEYDRLKSKMKMRSDNFKYYLPILVENKLPTTEKDLREWMKEFDLEEFEKTYTAYFRKCADDYLSRQGWLPNDEKKRIVKSFMDIAKLTERAAGAVLGWMEDYPVKEVDGIVAPDINGAEEVIIAQCTQALDTKKIADYWSMLVKLHNYYLSVVRWQNKNSIDPNAVFYAFRQKEIDIDDFINRYSFSFYATPDEAAEPKH